MPVDFKAELKLVGVKRAMYDQIAVPLGDALIQFGRNLSPEEYTQVNLASLRPRLCHAAKGGYRLPGAGLPGDVLMPAARDLLP